MYSKPRYITPIIMYNKKLPKSLWGFYFRYATRGNWWWLVGWAIAFTGLAMENVIFPITERMFIALFEQSVPSGMTFIEFAWPTIALIVVMLVGIDICNTLRSFLQAIGAHEFQIK